MAFHRSCRSVISTNSIPRERVVKYRRAVLSRKLEYLMALAKEGHFARAAALCHVSQPTLSAAMQDLEAELGVAIVRRGQRFQGLTPEGELVLKAATRMAA